MATATEKDKAPGTDGAAGSTGPTEAKVLPTEEELAEQAAEDERLEAEEAHAQMLADAEAERRWRQNATVIERICRIVAEMPAVGKGQRNEQQGFMFRGHDDVMNALNPLLSDYGVFFTPKVLERITDQRPTRNNSILYEVNLHVEYTFYGAKGDSFTADAWGEGTDSGDKSTNKAMTMALKNVLAQTFAVSTEEISRLDTDQHTDEPTTGRRSAEPKPPTTTDGIEIRPDAPLGWAAISATMRQLDPSMPWQDWVREALTLMTGEGALADLTDDEKRDTGIRIANGVAHLIVALDGREMPPPSRAEVQAAFAKQDAVGVVLSGPEQPIDPAEHAAAEAAKDDDGSQAEQDTAAPVEETAPDADPVEATPEQPEAQETPEEAAEAATDTLPGTGTPVATDGDIDWPGQAPT